MQFFFSLIPHDIPYLIKLNDSFGFSFFPFFCRGWGTFSLATRLQWENSLFSLPLGKLYGVFFL